MSAILNKPAEQMLSEHQHEHWNELHTSGLAAGEGSGLRGQSLPGALRDSQAAPPGPDLADAVKPPRHLSTTGRGQAGKGLVVATEFGLHPVTQWDQDTLAAVCHGEKLGC